MLGLKQFKYIFNKEEMYSEDNYKVLSGIFGLCVGDAIGVPVEFEPRELRNETPVKGMKGYGTHNQPPGTWSDDSSLTFCLADSLCHGVNLKDIAKKFCGWSYYGLWTADESLPFDIGNATAKAISNLIIGISPLESGGKEETCNGNGSLMRILPIAYYLQKNPKDKFKVIEEVSGITHSHIRSIIACSIYIEIALNLLNGYSLIESYHKMKPVILKHFEDKEYINELLHFNRILKDDISKLDVNSINSSGYVIDTLEASLWSLLRSNSYSEAVLKAVNLGNDTDTIASITGGLAGIYYGYKSIPPKWIKVIARRKEIEALCIKLSESLTEKI